MANVEQKLIMRASTGTWFFNDNIKYRVGKHLSIHKIEEQSVGNMPKDRTHMLACLQYDHIVPDFNFYIPWCVMFGRHFETLSNKPVADWELLHNQYFATSKCLFEFRTMFESIPWVIMDKRKDRGVFDVLKVCGIKFGSAKDATLFQGVIGNYI